MHIRGFKNDGTLNDVNPEFVSLMNTMSETDEKRQTSTRAVVEKFLKREVTDLEFAEWLATVEEYWSGASDMLPTREDDERSPDMEIAIDQVWFMTIALALMTFFLPEESPDFFLAAGTICNVMNDEELDLNSLDFYPESNQ